MYVEWLVAEELRGFSLQYFSANHSFGGKAQYIWHRESMRLVTSTLPGHISNPLAFHVSLIQSTERGYYLAKKNKTRLSMS